jgi:hypothetical protein
MAKQTFTRIVDDLTHEMLGEGEGQTIEFAFEGNSYTIDLSEKNADEFRKVMTKYTDAGTKEVARLPRAAASSAPKSNKDELAKIRQWAKDNGIEVSSRGRISQAIQDQYRAAH